VKGPDSAGVAKTPSARTLYSLGGLIFFLADVQIGVGPFLAIYLAGYKWNEERVGLALMVGGIAGILTQTPAGARLTTSAPNARCCRREYRDQNDHMLV
jgi:hypothetical protein